MKRLAQATLLGLTLLPGGCATTKYAYRPTGEIDAAAKPPGCAFVLLEQIPSQPYDEVGVLAPRDISFGDMSGGPTPFKESVTQQVCAAGGDAVVVEHDDQSRYVRGTVIKYKTADANANGDANANAAPATSAPASP